MSIETGVLVAKDGSPLYWHLPPGRSSAYLPDSRDLWNVIWENRDNIWGFAHSHPGWGTPSPSREDITTFSAIELALGRRLSWWICSEDEMILVRHENHKVTSEKDKQYQYMWFLLSNFGRMSSWLDELRQLSYNKEQ